MNQKPELTVSAPEVLGILIGPHAAHPVDDRFRLYGTDLGFAFEHHDELFIMFGDTLPTPDNICINPPNDDTIAKLSRSHEDGVPELTFRADPDTSDDFKRIQLLRGDESLSLGFGRAPMTAFSDGEHLFAAFDRLDLTHCVHEKDSGEDRCAANDEFACSTEVGECQPSYDGVVPPLCSMTDGKGCFFGQSCEKAENPVCVDKTSSQYDGTVWGEIAAAVQNTEFGLQRDDDPDTFDSVLTLPTSKFINVTSRTIARLGETSADDDYAPGHGALLLWGRPRYAGEVKREAQLYLMTHALPFELDDEHALRFAPRYFAGVDADSGEPRWSDKQSEAKPLAMDGVSGGDPHEPLHVVNQTTISWLGAPVNKWVMLYGGGLSNYLLLDSNAARFACAPDTIMLRFADHPWGPWSKPIPHLGPGDPSKSGAPTGPGGFLYDATCVDGDDAICARPDALISSSNVVPSCVSALLLWDNGRLYASNIIDSYTTPNDKDGLDIYWNVSTWNPYSVVLLKTSIAPASIP